MFHFFVCFCFFCISRFSSLFTDRPPTGDIPADIHRPNSYSKNLENQEMQEQSCENQEQTMSNLEIQDEHRLIWQRTLTVAIEYIEFPKSSRFGVSSFFDVSWMCLAFLGFLNIPDSLNSNGWFLSTDESNLVPSWRVPV